MAIHAYTLPVTTNAQGAGTYTHSRAVKGELVAVEWIVGTFASGVDATLTTIGPARTLLTLTDANANAIYQPRLVTHSNVGANLTTTDKPFVVGQLVLTIAQGGATLKGQMTVYIDEPES